MKNTSKLMLVAAALMAVSSARATTPASDILLGFTSGTGNDYLFNAGLATSFYNGETWTTAQGFNDPNTATVFGAAGYANGTTAQTKLIYSTTGSSTVGPSLTLNGYNTVKANINSFTAPAVNSGSTVAATSATSWYTETDQPAGTPGNYFFNNLDNPNTGVGTAAYLWSNDNNADAASLLGYFTVSADGSTLTFDTVAVPEPSTYGLIAGLGLLAVTLRRQFTAKA